MEETIEVINKLKEIQAGMPLQIGRIPPKTLEKFRKLANEDFCGDYGMTLDYLVRSIEVKELMFVIYDMERRITELEKKRGIRMLDGSIRGGKG